MRRALLCASSEYRDSTFTALKYPSSDVDELRRLLDERELCGFDEVTVLKNPTKAETHEAVECLTADSATEDLILFYFSGHGKLAHDGSVALVLEDTKEGRLLSTGLLDNELRVLFNASRARQRVIILDCCYSGAVGEEGFKRASSDAVEALAQQVKGTFVLAASTKFQPALECDEKRGSAFTSCLIEGVRTGAAAEKGTNAVTLSKLGEYLSREVPQRSNQQPKFWDFGGVGATIFAHVPKRFDGVWTDQTIKRLRQMMSREQIDDELFVELQQALRGQRNPPTREELRLIDDVAQRRLKPLPFLRKWHALKSTRMPAEVAPDVSPGRIRKTERSEPPALSEAENELRQFDRSEGADSTALPPADNLRVPSTDGSITSEASANSPTTQFAKANLPVEDGFASDSSSAHSNQLHLGVGIVALLSTIILPTFLNYDNYDQLYFGDEAINKRSYLPLGIVFLVIQIASIVCILGHFTSHFVRLPIILASIIGDVFLYVGIENQDPIQIRNSLMLTLGTTGLLLLALYVIRRRKTDSKE